MTPTITLPRKKHSHRCQICKHGVYCYKSQCQQPQRIEACANCRWHAKFQATQWTPAKVREELPEVQIRVREFNNYTCTAQISGRQNDFATVTYTDRSGNTNYSNSWEFSWQTIADALNNKRSLQS